MFNNKSNNNWNDISILRNLLNDNFLNSMVNQIISAKMGGNLVNRIGNESSYDIELKDFGEYYLIKGYLPGVTAKDVSIDFEKNKAILTIRRRRTYSNGVNFSMTIIGSAQDLVKNFYIDEIDPSKLKASFNDNLLMITLPKVNRPKNNYEYDDGDEPIIIDVDSYKVE
ncbi:MULTISPECIES: Hsp20/alpha crystallin family protein [Clostridium]|uniref:Hsp20 family protein n=1 Tax=Clostridium cibarium TaxID=2762247 RepID=A0ABR8PWQ4_9CLOT|nr:MULTISPECIES: Hsp20/alpha crystallin family protein [Clostridium]MBD7912585.1 Hsp20 family protein [Clostridium cibarium]